MRKVYIGACAAAAAVFAARPVGAQLTAQSLEPSFSGAQQSVKEQVKDQKAKEAVSVNQMKLEELRFGGGQRGGGHPGGFPGGQRPGPGPRPGPRPGPHPGPRPGRGDWSRWPGHPGWGSGRWAYRGGHWLWWGWAPWVVGSGLACDAYYSSSYRACTNAAWANNAACVQSCGATGDPQGCNAACAAETQDAVGSCEWSYRNAWTCGGGVLWPPVGVVIRIP